MIKNRVNTSILNEKKLFVNVWLNVFLGIFLGSYSFSQVSYDNCGQALEICPNVSFSINNIAATKTFCANCDDNFSFCFTPKGLRRLKRPAF